MNRPIKFRAWDKKEKKWLFGYELPALGGFSMFGEIMMFGEYAKLLSDYFPDRLNDIILMQFTSLLDKNGREIYEGDVVRDSTNEKMGLVGWNATWMKWDVGAEGHWAEDALYCRCYIEVIGNIYENPEILPANEK